MHPQRHLGLALIVTLLSFALIACGGDDDGGGSSGGSSGSYVTPGIDATLYAALLSDGATALFFATDTTSIHATLRGSAPAEGAPLSLTNEAGDSVAATPAGDGYAGTLTLADGSTHDFTVEKVSRNNGGLYRNQEIIRDEAWIIGLIVLNDGKIVGAARNSETNVVEKRSTLSLGLKWTNPTTDPERQ
ncbi:MAG TPA: hypothetical protein VFS30_03860 [Dehalococcoidia bacterium]|nr:hypothetical protein [Dehalococcoidia bacterium]